MKLSQLKQIIREELSKVLVSEVTDYTLSIKDLGDNVYKVLAVKSGKTIGELMLIKSKFKPVLKGTSVTVDPSHRREGVASAMYEFAEAQLKMKFVRSDNVLTTGGKALWDNPNRKFGL